MKTQLATGNFVMRPSSRGSSATLAATANAAISTISLHQTVTVNVLYAAVKTAAATTAAYAAVDVKHLWPLLLQSRHLWPLDVGITEHTSSPAATAAAT